MIWICLCKLLGHRVNNEKKLDSNGRMRNFRSSRRRSLHTTKNSAREESLELIEQNDTMFLEFKNNFVKDYKYAHTVPDNLPNKTLTAP